MALLVMTPTPERAVSARQFLENSLRRDPHSAEAWSQLAFVFVNDFLNRWNEAKESPEGAGFCDERRKHCRKR